MRLQEIERIMVKCCLNRLKTRGFFGCQNFVITIFSKITKNEHLRSSNSQKDVIFLQEL